MEGSCFGTPDPSRLRPLSGPEVAFLEELKARAREKVKEKMKRKKTRRKKRQRQSKQPF
jgi:hypothetical protein